MVILSEKKNLSELSYGKFYDMYLYRTYILAYKKSQCTGKWQHIGKLLTQKKGKVTYAIHLGSFLKEKRKRGKREGKRIQKISF